MDLELPRLVKKGTKSLERRIKSGGEWVASVVSNLKKNTNKETSIGKLLSDEDRYNGDKSIIEDAINEKDWETLEDMLESSTSDFPDLINMINNALKNR